MILNDFEGCIHSDKFEACKYLYMSKIKIIHIVSQLIKSLSQCFSLTDFESMYLYRS